MKALKISVKKRSVCAEKNGLIAKRIGQHHLSILSQSVMLSVIANDLDLTTLSKSNLLKRNSVQTETVRNVLEKQQTSMEPKSSRLAKQDKRWNKAKTVSVGCCIPIIHCTKQSLLSKEQP